MPDHNGLFQAGDPLELLYQDQDLVAIHKPAGLMVHKSPLSQDQAFALQVLRDQLGQWVYPVHRLDRGTSGVLLFGLSSAVAQGLAQAFLQRQVHKEYLALVRGFCPAAGQMDWPLEEEGKLQEAFTPYHCLQQIELPLPVPPHPTSRFSLVRLLPATGRRHQIRRHLNRLGYPILGDSQHGSGLHNQVFAQAFGFRRLLLFATRLSLLHPVTGQRLELHAPLAEPAAALFASWGWGRL